MKNQQLTIPTQDIQSFQFSSQEVRTEIINNEVWFCLADITEILNIQRGSRVVERLNPKGVRKTYTLTDGGQQELLFINESNLYKLIFRSNKAEARAFEDWVTGEVLPAIRKTGSYSAKPQLDTPSTKEDRKPLTTLISTLVSVAPISYRDVWHMIKAELKTCKSASEFTVSEVFVALTFVQSKIDLYCFEANKDDVSKAFVSKVELAALSILRAVDREEAQRYLTYRNALALSRQQVNL